MLSESTTALVRSLLDEAKVLSESTTALVRSLLDEAKVLLSSMSPVYESMYTLATRLFCHYHSPC